MSKNEFNTSEIPHKPCVACQSLINVGATVCIHCGANQKRWIDALKFVAGISSVIALVGSLIVYSITTIPDIRKIFAWNDDIQILAYVESSELAVLNTGDGNVFLSYIKITRAPIDGMGSGSTTTPIQKLVKQGDFLSQKLDTINKFYAGVYLREEDEPFSDKWVTIANRAVDYEDKCYTLEIRLASDQVYLQILEHYTNDNNAGPMTIPHNAILYFYSIEQNKLMSKVIDIVALVRKNDFDECDYT